jgi:hypothetical protein
MANKGVNKMKRGYAYGFGGGFCFPPFGFHFWGPWSPRSRGAGFPKRADYLRMLEQYKEYLEAMQSDIAKELKEVDKEIEKLKRE